MLLTANTPPPPAICLGKHSSKRTMQSMDETSCLREQQLPPPPERQWPTTVIHTDTSAFISPSSSPLLEVNYYSYLP